MTAVLFYTGPSLRELHEDYAKKQRIDDRAAITGRRDITVNAPPAVVWALLSDVTHWDKNLEPGVHDIRVPDGVLVNAPFTRVNKGATLKARFAVVEPERELAWTGSAFGAKVVHRYVLEALPGGGTRVVVEESMAGPAAGGVLLHQPQAARTAGDLPGYAEDFRGNRPLTRGAVPCPRARAPCWP